MVKDINFEILDSAANQIEKIVKNEKQNTHLRIEILGGGCAGSSYKIDLDDTIALIKQHTRHYAKRQMTWIRRKESNAIQINPIISDEELVRILPKHP